jgi:hypothetical protein
MRSSGVMVGCLFAALACGAAERSLEPAVPERALPERITPAWYVANFPNCTDDCGDPVRDSLWVEIRDRPDLVDALVRVIESPVTDAWTRANAVLRLGATAQDRAYRYIRDRLDALPEDDPDAASWIVALGSGHGPIRDDVYQTLAAQLGIPYRAEAAIFILGEIGTARARAILEETAAATADASLRTSIQRALREWTPRRDREPT